MTISKKRGEVGLQGRKGKRGGRLWQGEGKKKSPQFVRGRPCGRGKERGTKQDAEKGGKKKGIQSASRKKGKKGSFATKPRSEPFNPPPTKGRGEEKVPFGRKERKQRRAPLEEKESKNFGPGAPRHPYEPWRWEKRFAKKERKGEGFQDRWTEGAPTSLLPRRVDELHVPGVSEKGEDDPSCRRGKESATSAKKDIFTIAFSPGTECGLSIVERRKGRGPAQRGGE